MRRLFYLKKAADAEQKKESQLFLRLAGEVEKHQRILETILASNVRPEPG
jgi:rubrerythrin